MIPQDFLRFRFVGLRFYWATITEKYSSISQPHSDSKEFDIPTTKISSGSTPRRTIQGYLFTSTKEENVFYRKFVHSTLSIRAQN